MQTIDIHTHLLSREVRFNRPFDKIAIRLFGKKLGLDPALIQRNTPYDAYVAALTTALQDSHYLQKACLFGVDSRLDTKGREIARDPTVCARTEDVLDVCRRYPSLFIPFFSLHPWRPDALELIDEYVEKGCCGATFLQNYWGVDCNDTRLIPYYERLAHHRLPLIIHLGSEYTIDSEKHLECVGMLELPLACDVTVIGAHMALGHTQNGAYLWRNFSRDPRYFGEDYHRLLELLDEHPNLYADISAIVTPLRLRALRHLSEQAQIHRKLLFGTDFPVPFSLHLGNHGLPKEKVRQIEAIHNPFDRYVSAILEYFPEDSSIYRNYQQLLPDGRL